MLGEITFVENPLATEFTETIKNSEAPCEKWSKAFIYFIKYLTQILRYSLYSAATVAEIIKRSTVNGMLFTPFFLECDELKADC